MSTLAERIHERLKATGLKNAHLAAAARVRPPTAHNWGSGKTKAIKGKPLLLAAAALGVTPDWLATGNGPKLAAGHNAGHRVQEPSATYGATPDPWIQEAVQILSTMSRADRRAAVLQLRVFSKSLGPPGHGDNLPVAA